METFEEMWSQIRPVEIAAKLEIPLGQVYRMARQRKLPSRQSVLASQEDKNGPTTEEIEQRAAEIRKTWSRAERERRHVGGPRRWTLPELQMSETEAPSFSRI